MGLERLLEETPEAYYWAGFLMADGCIQSKRSLLRLKIDEKDEQHIKRFSEFIGTKYNKYSHKYSYKSKKITQTFVTIEKASKEIVPVIIKKFNFIDSKTYNPPNNLVINNDELFISFIIGYFDGDATISKNGNNELSIRCHRLWSNCLDSWFLRIWNLSACEIINKNKIPKTSINNNVARIGTKNQKFVWFLKCKAKELNIPYLQRKWNRIIMKKSFIDNNGNIQWKWKN